MVHTYKFDCEHCGSKNYLDNVEQDSIGKDIKIKCHSCKKVSKIHLKQPEPTEEALGVVGGIFVWVAVLFIVGMFLPSLGAFSSCESNGYFSRPFCVTSSIYQGITEDSSSSQNIQNPETERQQPVSNYHPQQPSQPVVPKQVHPSLTTEERDEINAQISIVQERYDYCVKYVKEKTKLVPYIRDQATLYLYDGDVKNCVNEYLIQAKTLSELVIQKKEKISRADGERVKNSILTQANYLRPLSQNYLQLSEQRHYYIHGVYQTQQLINLAQIIGETAGAVSEGDAIGTVSSLQSLYEWWYYNGGVIDTGWGY
ncbi:MAG: hypothetical protein AABX53_01130 [Nanoarchaeota archaeon]